MEILLFLIALLLVLILVELKKMVPKKESDLSKDFALIGRQLPFPEFRANGALLGGFPLSPSLFFALKPTSQYPVFPESQIAYAYRLYSAVNHDDVISNANSEEELSRKCYQLLMSQTAGKICDAMIEANIAALNGKLLAEANDEYLRKTTHLSLKEPDRIELKKLYEEELQRWKRNKNK